MSYTLDLLKQLADGLARQFGPDCEIVIHDLEKHDLEHSIVHINNVRPYLFRVRLSL